MGYTCLEGVRVAMGSLRYRGDCNKIGDMPTWSGIIQVLESSKASERPVDDDGDLVAPQVPVKGWYKQGW